MGSYRPPYGPLSFLLSGPRESKRMDSANRQYVDGYNRGKGFKHGSR